MSSELGAEWRSRFTDFSSVPMASASIGQVHSGSITRNGVVTPVAVKIQFPGVSTSISSDLSNLALLLRTSALLPKGLFLDNTLRVMRGELEDECDYVREADCARRFGEFLGVGERGEEGNKGGFFRVPRIIDELSTSNVLTMERMEGVPLSRVGGLSQEKRNLVRPWPCRTQSSDPPQLDVLLIFV
jgi:aarF domain-containing kinase